MRSLTHPTSKTGVTGVTRVTEPFNQLKILDYFELHHIRAQRIPRVTLLKRVTVIEPLAPCWQLLYQIHLAGAARLVRGEGSHIE